MSATARKRHLGPWVVGGLLLAVYAPTMLWLVHRWSLGVWYHVHGFVVLPIAGWLAWRALRNDRGEVRDASALGFLFLVPAVLLQVADTALGFQVLSAVSLVLALPGLALLLLGRARTARLWFPLLFVAFVVPIPLGIARRIHLVLRRFAATGVEWFLSAIGYDVAREDTWLRVGPESIQIADACSGFSTLLVLTMAALLLAYLARGGWARTLLFLALVFPLAVVANTARCVALSMLVVAYGQDILATWAHEGSGIAAFAFAIGALLLVEAVLLPARQEKP